MATLNQASVDSLDAEPVMLMHDVSMMSGSLPIVPQVKRKYEPRTWLHNSNNSRARIKKLRQYVNPDKPGPNLYIAAVSSNKGPPSPQEVEEKDRFADRLRLDCSTGLLHRAIASPAESSRFLKIARSQEDSLEDGADTIDSGGSTARFITEPQRQKALSQLRQHHKSSTRLSRNTSKRQVGGLDSSLDQTMTIG